MILNKYIEKKEYNFLSLMDSYEGNYTKLLKVIPVSLFTEKNQGKSFIARSSKSTIKLILSFDFISDHTSILSFSYDYGMNDKLIIFSKLKIYFDSQQVELLNNKEFYNLYIKEFFSRCKYRSLEMSKVRANFYLSLWLDFCSKNNYSFK